MPDRRTYLELLYSEVDAAAKEFARTLWENVNQGMTVGLEADVDIAELTGLTADIPEEDIADLILPGFRLQVSAALVQLATEAEYAWHDVFFSNLKARYDNEGRIEP